MLLYGFEKHALSFLKSLKGNWTARTGPGGSVLSGAMVGSRQGE